jgi:hypothetical protein
MENLWEMGAKVRAFDPEAMHECERIYGNRDDLQLCGTRDSALSGSTAATSTNRWIWQRPGLNISVWGARRSTATSNCFGL